MLNHHHRTYAARPWLIDLGEHQLFLYTFADKNSMVFYQLTSSVWSSGDRCCIIELVLIDASAACACV